MSEEAKEILDRLQDSVNYPKIDMPTFDGSDSEYIDNDTLLEPSKCKLLLNYITNLQKENQSLKNELKSKPDNEITLETKDGQIMTIIQSERIDMQEKLNKSLEEMYKKYQDYKQRNEKAIEFIKNETEDLANKIDDYAISKYLKRDLLNILEGGDE